MSMHKQVTAFHSSLFQFSSRWCLCVLKSRYTLHPVSPLAYLQYRALSWTITRLAPYQSASHCVFHGFTEWAVVSFDGTEVCSTCCTFCLVCTGGRSSMNRMISVGVSLVVPSMTRIASFRTLSSFSRYVCAIVVRPSP